MSLGKLSFLHVIVANDANVVSEAVADSATMGASQLVPQTRVLLASARVGSQGTVAMKHVAMEGDRFFCFYRESVFTFACVVDVAGGLVGQKQERVADFLLAVRSAYMLNSKNSASGVAGDPDEDELLLGGSSPFATSDAPLDDQLRRLLNEFNTTTPVQAQNRHRWQPVHQIQIQIPPQPPQDPTASVVYAAGDQYRAYASEVEQTERQRKLRRIAGASCVAVSVFLIWFLL